MMYSKAFGYFLPPFHNPTISPYVRLRQDLEICGLVDDLGFDEVWLGEHHSSGWSTLSAPDLLIAALARETRRVRFATGVIPLPLSPPSAYRGADAAARPRDRRSSDSGCHARRRGDRRLSRGARAQFAAVRTAARPGSPVGGAGLTEAAHHHTLIRDSSKGESAVYRVPHLPGRLSRRIGHDVQRT
jgi:hypothetical protein